jgi:uncharacterized protein YqhQ
MLAGKHPNPVTNILSVPGLWVQRITTKEPDDKQIECAIAAIKAALPAEFPEEIKEEEQEVSEETDDKSLSDSENI